MKAGTLKIGTSFKVFGFPFLFKIVDKNKTEVVCNIFGMDGLFTYPRKNFVIKY